MFINRTTTPDILFNFYEDEDEDQDDIDEQYFLEYAVISLKPESIIKFTGTTKGMVIIIENSMESGLIDSNM